MMMAATVERIKSGMRYEFDRSAPPDGFPALPPIPVTAFRDYLESPRQFFFLHVLKLRNEGEAPLELEPGPLGRKPTILTS